MRIKKIIGSTGLLFLSLVSCHGLNNFPENKKTTNESLTSPGDTSKDYAKILNEKENASRIQRNNSGKIISSIVFALRPEKQNATGDSVIPSIQVEFPEKEINHLIGKDQIVLPYKKVMVIIDYPLNNEAKFELTSDKTGFTRAQLISEVSKQYHKIYDEEEKTATIKTIPLSKRTKMYNRNETNGKYGIWGHDLGDLYLDDILVHKTEDGQIILTLEIDS